MQTVSVSGVEGRGQGGGNNGIVPGTECRNGRRQARTPILPILEVRSVQRSMCEGCFEAYSFHADINSHDMCELRMCDQTAHAQLPPAPPPEVPKTEEKRKAPRSEKRPGWSKSSWLCPWPEP